jgi:hypothetical protein
MPGEAQACLFQAFGTCRESIYPEMLTGLYFAFCIGQREATGLISSYEIRTEKEGARQCQIKK